MNKIDVLFTLVFTAMIAMFVVSFYVSIKSLFVEELMYLRVMAYIASVISLFGIGFTVTVFIWLIDWEK